jgi:HNH endonuclease
MVTRIPLGNDAVALIDDDDLPLVKGYQWEVHHIHGRNYEYHYARRFVREDGVRRTQYMHRQILGVPKGVDVDHIDGDGLNNCRSNLRPATRSQNAMNSRRHGGTSGVPFKGVFLHVGGKYQARIKVGRETIHLGSFVDAREAALAYDAAARRYFGRFARPNFDSAGMDL